MIENTFIGVILRMNNKIVFNTVGDTHFIKIRNDKEYVEISYSTEADKEALEFFFGVSLKDKDLDSEINDYLNKYSERIAQGLMCASFGKKTVYTILDNGLKCRKTEDTDIISHKSVVKKEQEIEKKDRAKSIEEGTTSFISSAYEDKFYVSLINRNYLYALEVKPDIEDKKINETHVNEFLIDLYYNLVDLIPEKNKTVNSISLLWDAEGKTDEETYSIIECKFKQLLTNLNLTPKVLMKKLNTMLSVENSTKSVIINMETFEYNGLLKNRVSEVLIGPHSAYLERLGLQTECIRVRTIGNFELIIGQNFIILFDSKNINYRIIHPISRIQEETCIQEMIGTTNSESRTGRSL